MKVLALLCACLFILNFNLRAAETPANASGVETKTDPAAKKEKAEANTVTIDNFTFSPKMLTIAPGTTVTWINRDDVPHTVKSTDNKFKSGTLDTDEKFTFTFTEEGTFKYFCTIHAHMTGEIIVKK